MMTMRSRFCLFLLYGCLLLLGTLAGIPTSLSASSSTIVGTDGLRLQTIIDRAAPHEKIILEPGLYQGPVLINKPLILESTGAAIIDGGGKGRVVTIDAPDVTVRGLTIRNSGRRLDIEDSGVFVTPRGAQCHRRKQQNSEQPDRGLFERPKQCESYPKLNRRGSNPPRERARQWRSALENAGINRFRQHDQLGT